MTFVPCIYDKKVEEADKTEYLLQVLNWAIFIFQVEGHKKIQELGPLAWIWKATTTISG